MNGPHTVDRVDSGEVGNAIGSSEPTAEQMCHWTPEMIAMAHRNGAQVPAEDSGGDWEGPGIDPAASDITEGVEAGAAEPAGQARE